MSKHVLEKWTESHVAAGREPAVQTLDDFERVLGDATDERPLQTLLASFPVLLGPLAQPGGTLWCLDRPRLGSEFVPDFLLASITSVGFQWTMIELESPTEKALTKSGLPTKKLAPALKQIRDWRTWLTDNVAYARGELVSRTSTPTARPSSSSGGAEASIPSRSRHTARYPRTESPSCPMTVSSNT